MFGNPDITEKTIEAVKRNNGKIEYYIKGEDMNFIINLKDAKSNNLSKM